MSWFISGLKSGVTKHMFQAPAVLGRIPQKIDIENPIVAIDVFCHCQMPASYGNMIQCDDCNEEYHGSCYLLNEDIAKDLENFICYNCRSPGQYFYMKNFCAVDFSAIQDFTKSLLVESETVFRKILPLSIHRPESKQILVCNAEQLARMEHLISMYDLNSVGLKEGSVYSTLLSLYKKSGQSFNKGCFMELNRAELVHFALLAICNVQRLSCPPLFFERFESNMASLPNKQSIAEQKKWLLNIKKELTSVSKKINQFVHSKNSKQVIQEKLSSFHKDLDMASENASEGLKIRTTSTSDLVKKSLRTIHNCSLHILSEVEYCKNKLDMFENLSLHPS